MERCPACGQPIRNARLRSTGPRSQSAHLHGHLQQIATECGYHMGEIKDVMKEDLASWPVRCIKVGSTIQSVPISESDATPAEESDAIEWCHQRAAELGIVLRED